MAQIIFKKSYHSNLYDNLQLYTMIPLSPQYEISFFVSYLI